MRSPRCAPPRRSGGATHAARRTRAAIPLRMRPSSRAPPRRSGGAAHAARRARAPPRLHSRRSALLLLGAILALDHVNVVTAAISPSPPPPSPPPPSPPPHSDCAPAQAPVAPSPSSPPPHATARQSSVACTGDTIFQAGVQSSPNTDIGSIRLPSTFCIEVLGLKIQNKQDCGSWSHQDGRSYRSIVKLGADADSTGGLLVYYNRNCNGVNFGVDGEYHWVNTNSYDASDQDGRRGASAGGGSGAATR